MSGGVDSATITVERAARMRLLVDLVKNREMCATDLAEAVGVTRNAISQDLIWLASRGFIRHNGRRSHLSAFVARADAPASSTIEGTAMRMRGAPVH